MDLSLTSLGLSPWLIGAGLNTVLAIIATMAPKKLLTRLGLIHAWALGIIIWGTLGWQGYMVIMFYFLVGSAVTRVGMARKEAAGIAENRSGARGPENVWGSALTGTLCALGIWGIEHWSIDSVAFWSTLLLLGYVASLCTKLSDTCASEVGKAYGQRTFLITTLKPVPRGTEGAVSVEGTLAGIMASMAIASISWLLGLIAFNGIAISMIAAFIATTIESIIGATLQEQISWLTNEIVNIINTMIGAGVAMVIMLALSRVGT